MTDAEPNLSAQSMHALLARQRASFMADLPVSLEVRHDRLTRAIALLVDHGEALCEAMAQDFGGRSRTQSMLTDIVPSINALKHARKHTAKWMKPEGRRALFPLGLLGGKAEIQYQPKGVVGIISPWNFPVILAMSPLAGVLAAGNRAMIKPSELTPATAELLKRLVAEAFDQTELTVVTGGPDIGKAFAGLAFDHLIFTGGTEIGRHVMRAAADNLVPVTLELGGKSPVIIGTGADLDQTAERIVMGKMMNAGQICLAPDYLLVPAEHEEALVAKIEAAAAKFYPTVGDNDDYAAIINDRHHARLTDAIADARTKGGDVRVVGDTNGNARKMPLHIVRNPTDDMTVMRDELFGPVLPIKSVASTDEAIAYVNGHDRPLALYYFGNDAAEEARVRDRTISGGVTVNDVVFHVAMEELPFGGIGPSGMGSYHGREGFMGVSHAKSVYRQTKLDVAKLAGLKPPYGKAAQRAIAREFKK